MSSELRQKGSTVVQVRRFEDQDARALTDLMIEMARFYGATIHPDLVVAADVVRQAQQVDIVIAYDNAQILGFATFTSFYPVAGLLAFTMSNKSTLVRQHDASALHRG